MDIDKNWYGWSTKGPLQVLLFFGQIRPGADPGRGQNRSVGVPFFKKLLLQTGRLQQPTEFIAMIWKHVGRSVVIFGSIPKSNVWRIWDVFLDLVILPYFNAISTGFYAVKCLVNSYLMYEGHSETYAIRIFPRNFVMHVIKIWRNFLD